MKNENTLFLECRGCYFRNDDPVTKESDIGNYRVGSYNYSIQAKNGRQYVIEFGTYTKYTYRTHHKKNGKQLKHPVKELVKTNALHISTQFENEKGCWADLSLEKQMHSKLFSYNRRDILKMINEISIKQYDKIILLPSEKIISELENIYKLGGYREKNILDNLTDVKTVLYNNDYWVLRFIDNSGNTFEYEYFSKRITN